MRTRNGGRAAIFNEDQNAALRQALQDIVKEGDAKGELTQTAVGLLLGVSQQVAGRLIKDPTHGFSYNTATRLVRHLRFAGVDNFFRSRGVATPKESSTSLDVATAEHARAAG